MKTFRFFATLLVIALCAGFTSCSDDDDENPLVGTWVSIENRNSVEYKDVMTINSDGTGSSAIYENGQIDKDGVDNFRYTYDENSKVFTWIWEEDSDGSDVYSMHVRELTGSKLVLVDDMDDEGEGEVYYIHKTIIEFKNKMLVLLASITITYNLYIMESLLMVALAGIVGEFYLFL